MLSLADITWNEIRQLVQWPVMKKKLTNGKKITQLQFCLVYLIIMHFSIQVWTMVLIIDKERKILV